jgi:hypothetical protein
MDGGEVAAAAGGGMLVRFASVGMVRFDVEMALVVMDGSLDASTWEERVGVAGNGVAILLQACVLSGLN